MCLQHLQQIAFGRFLTALSRVNSTPGAIEWFESSNSRFSYVPMRPPRALPPNRGSGAHLLLTAQPTWSPANRRGRRPGAEGEGLPSRHSCKIDLSPLLRNHKPSRYSSMMGTVGIAAWSSAMRRMLPRTPILVSMHKPLSRSVAAGRVAHQCFSSILKMIKRFHQRNAWTLFVTTFAATLVSTTIAWIWMLVGATKWAFGF
jgi:hypothetical protein